MVDDAGSLHDEEGEPVAADIVWACVDAKACIEVARLDLVTDVEDLAHRFEFKACQLDPAIVVEVG